MSRPHTRESEIEWMLRDPLGVAIEMNERLRKENKDLKIENHLLRRAVEDQVLRIEKLREEVKTAYDDYWGT